MSRVLPWLTVCQNFKYLICIGICLQSLFQNSFWLNSELLFALISYISAQYLCFQSLFKNIVTNTFIFKTRVIIQGYNPILFPTQLDFLLSLKRWSNLTWSLPKVRAISRPCTGAATMCITHFWLNAPDLWKSSANRSWPLCWSEKEHTDIPVGFPPGLFYLVRMLDFPRP